MIPLRLLSSSHTNPCHIHMPLGSINTKRTKMAKSRLYSFLFLFYISIPEINWKCVLVRGEEQETDIGSQVKGRKFDFCLSTYLFMIFPPFHPFRDGGVFFFSNFVILKLDDSIQSRKRHLRIDRMLQLGLVCIIFKNNLMGIFGICVEGVCIDMVK